MKTDKRNLTEIAAALAVIVFGVVAVFLLNGFCERNRPPLPDGYADEDLSLQGARLKGYSLGFEGLLADWYWMRSLQYIGEKVVASDTEKNTTLNLENLNSLNPRLLYPLLDNATTLDSKFTAVYSYGAVVLPAIDRRQAIKLVEKGIADNPYEWQLYGQLGYIYWRLNDYERAADAYSAGAKIDGAPPFMKLMAAKMLSTDNGGGRETARAVYEQMLEAAGDRQLKENAALRLLELDSLDERDAIDAALHSFREKNNRCAGDWREITPALLQAAKTPENKKIRADDAGNLIDPTGAPYLLDGENCRAQLDPKRTKIPLK